MKKLDIPDIAPLKARADAEYKKSAEALDRVIEYRNECSNLLDTIQRTSRDRRYLSDVWLNANTYERQYLREERRHRRRGDRFMDRYDRAVIKIARAEMALLDPNLGKAILAEYEGENIKGEVWIDYAKDPTNIFQETRDRLDQTSVKEEAKA